MKCERPCYQCPYGEFIETVEGGFFVCNAERDESEDYPEDD